MPVHVLEGELDESNLKKYKVVVITDMPYTQQLKIADICRANNIHFISTEIRGLFGRIFNDFGPQFEIIDTNGEEPLHGMIANISKEQEGIVTCLDEVRHGLEDGDYVTFKEIQGMTELNDITPRPVKVLGPYSFSIGDTSQFGDYTSNGLFTQDDVPIRPRRCPCPTATGPKAGYYPRGTSSWNLSRSNVCSSWMFAEMSDSDILRAPLDSMA